MSSKKIHLIIYVLAIALSSCENLFFEKDLASLSPQENFDYLWNECNEKYSYFEVKNIDWEAVRQKYEPKIYDDMSQDSLFNVLGAMLCELRDDHTNLISNFNISRFGVVYLGQENFNWRVIVDNYIGRNYYISGAFKHNFLANKSIGYIKFDEFTGEAGKQNLDFILNRYKDTKGLILDLRKNGGGAVSDVFEILSRFVDEKTLVGYTRIKNGKKHNDFSDDEPMYVTPYDGIRYTKKIIFLTDRGTYSAGSFTSLAGKAIPNITLMGDTTGGGLGMPNGGQLPNGWRYRFSVTQALTLDKNPNYEKGVPPDITVLFNWSDLSKDEILERAMEEILKR